MAKASASLEEGLNRSADHRGLSGKERHRYIGGALHNMGKARTRSGKREPAPTRAHTAPVPAPARKEHAPSVKRGTAPAPGRTKLPRKPGQTGFRPKPKPRERLDLTVKANTAASKGKPYTVYSIYRGKELYKGGGQYRKASAARAEAKIEMDAHNHPHGIHSRGQLAV